MFSKGMHCASLLAGLRTCVYCTLTFGGKVGKYFQMIRTILIVFLAMEKVGFELGAGGWDATTE